MSNPWVDSLIRVGTRLVSALKAGPPKNVFNPEYLTGNNFLKRFNEVKRAEGFGAAYNKTRMESTLRKGSFVGKDYNGNMYYEDKNAPYGRTRWVEYPTPKGIWAIEQNYDASMVRNLWPTRSCLKAQLARAWHETERVSCAARPHAGEPGVARLAALHARQAGQRAGALALPAPQLWCRASARTVRPSPTRHPRPIVGPETRRCSSPPPPLSPQAAEHEKPFKMALPINQSMQRPEFGRESEFHQPPGTMAARIVRGKVGPKYESWSGSVQTTNPALRNCECQTPPRGSSLPPLPPKPLSPKPPPLWPRARARARSGCWRSRAGHLLPQGAASWRGRIVPGVHGAPHYAPITTTSLFGKLCPALTPRAQPRPSRRLRQRENASHPVERPASV